MTRLLLLALLILFVNLPFGYWRHGLRKFSLAWLLAIHAPVPLVIGMRLGLGIPWRLETLPLFVASYFTGQLLGARIRAHRGRIP
jgi:hypothetical protein